MYNYFQVPECSTFVPMVREILIEEYFLAKAPLIDVRSPCEYTKGHIPGSVNIPLFSDAERAQLGIVYKQQSHEKAIVLGLDYVQPKLDSFITQSKVLDPNGKLVVHCWRGGMRSRSFAQHLSDNGFPDVSVIQGGYKAYRHNILSYFDVPAILRIIGGYTGSGKTYIIQELQKRGFQALDLEGLARHKGSAFGSLENQTQPTVEQFENNLSEHWRKLDLSRPVWLEDESHNIGAVNIPENLFRQMQNGRVYFLDIPKTERAKHLVAEYAGADPASLAESIQKISKRLGGLQTKLAFQYLEEKNFYELAFLTLGYYDKCYLKGISYRDQSMVIPLKMDRVDHTANTNSLLQSHQTYE